MEEKSRILKKATDDKSRPVSFKDSFGGSESQFRLLLKHVPDENFKDINLILNSTNFDLLETSSGRVILAFQTVEERQRRLERRKLFMKLQKKKNNSSNNILEKKFSSKIIHEIIKNKCEVVKSLQVNGVTNISVPVFDHTNQAIAAVTIPFLQRIKKDSLNDMSLINTTKLLKDQALILSKSLGFKS